MSDSIPALPSFSDEALAGLASAALVELMIEHEDRVPRNVIDECARRGSEMVALLAPLVDDERWAHDELTLGEWWLRLHTAMILGLMEEDAAASLLLGLMRRADAIGDDALQEWLSCYWAALFRNKSDEALASARALAEDPSVGWYVRADAAYAVIGVAAACDDAALEQALAWGAGIAFDEAQDFDVRMHVANFMLDHPKPQYRARLEALADIQRYQDRVFDRGDIEWAYSHERSDDERARWANPWSFYTPEEIARRQRRWATEDAKLAVACEEAFLEPYVRATPKVGRNDPCPCGSGKKYKKCCLGTVSAASTE